MQEDITLLQRGTTAFHLRRGWEDIAQVIPLPALWNQHRGEALAFPAQNGTVRAKRKCRGGLLAPLLPDLYPPWRVDALLARYSEAYRRGLPSARLVGVVSEPAGPLIVRLAVITEEIAPAETLSQRLASGRASEKDMIALGGEVRSLHRAGFLHGDLNTMNVIMPSQDRPTRLLDLDDARYTAGPAPSSASEKEIIRLARSIVKGMHASDISSPDPLARSLFRGYADGADDRVEALAKKLAATVRFRRIFW
ncbi:MAG: hypothetical protein HYT87_06720 [Nitrospirae bacterium]|nr:hypothetical protein [Nitrospirota bacterium]